MTTVVILYSFKKQFLHVIPLRYIYMLYTNVMKQSYYTTSGWKGSIITMDTQTYIIYKTLFRTEKLFPPLGVAL